MNSSKIEYPIFHPNQILSADDLNKSFDYLNEQGLLTRANLIGTGIIFGLDVEFSDNIIKISKGYGTTSGGRYVYLDENKEFGYYRKSNKFSSLADRYEVYELSTNKETSDWAAITSVVIDNFLVAICYEELDDSKPCTACGSANYTGSKKTVKIRVLLLKKQVSSESNNQETAGLLPIQCKRLTGLDIELNVPQINESIKNSYNALKHILTIEYNDSNHKIKISDQIEKKQIHHDFLCDVTEAYEEFRLCAEKVLSYGDHSETSFPCHLILGKINANDKDKDRHVFVAKKTYNDLCEELRWLWKRIVTMIDFFDPKVNPATDNSIRLTPSIYGAVPLSEKAIPYYYKKKDGDNPSENQKALDELHKAWTGRKNKIGYWYKESDASYLNYDLEKYNFVRIEGHIGDIPQDSNIQNIVSDINEKAKSFNLPIQAIALSTNAVDAAPCIQKIGNNFLLCLRRDAERAVSDILNTLNNSIVEAANTAITASTDADRATNLIEANDALTKAKEALYAIVIPEGDDVVSAVITVVKNDVQGVMGAINQVVDLMKSNAGENEVSVAKKGAVDAAAKVQEAVDAKNATEHIVHTGDIDIYLEAEEHSSINNYKIIVSFACKVALLDSKSKEIISFLHWLNSARIMYQQCEANKVFSSFALFKDKHPGLQHKSGVPIGGTFILVYDDKNKIVADFCLPYRVTQPD